VTRAQLEWVVASMRTGALLHTAELEEVPAQLEELAATLPEIFGTAETGCLERIASRLGAETGRETFAEVLLLSESRVHVIQPLVGRSGEALLASAPVGRSVGLILSQVHARATELEKEPE
jgi:hypothetical protein